MKVLLFGLLVVCSACGGSSSGGSTMPTQESGDSESGEVGSLAVHNTSSFDITSIQLSPYDDDSWGNNLIEGDALMHGEDAKVAVFDCKKYDLRMLDDENVECVVQDIDLCFEDKQWTIDNTVLSVCATGWAD
ncbi:MAG: hypothetical protein AB7O24_11350 [Kofleriaceae bacterium]